MTRHRGVRYGWRARIGFVTPATGVTRPFEFQELAPEGVAGFETRVKPDTADTDRLSEDFINSMVEQVAPAVETLEAADVDAVVQGGTPFIFINGPGFGEDLLEELEALTSRPVVLMALAIRHAIEAIGAETVTLCTYYNDRFSNLYRTYLEAFDLEVAQVWNLVDYLPEVERMDDLSPVELGEIPYDATYRAAVDAVHADESTEALVLSGGNLPTVGLLETLEEDLRRPVISSNQAATWEVLRTCGVNEPIDGYGTLLRRDADGDVL